MISFSNSRVICYGNIIGILIFLGAVISLSTFLAWLSIAFIVYEGYSEEEGIATN